MASNEYVFVDRWRVRGTVEEVAKVLSDGPDLARWWPSTYLEVRPLTPGDDRGIGQTGTVYAKGWLPYHIRFNYRVIDSNPPHGFAIAVEGDLTGRGVWTFEQDNGFVNLTYEWRIRADKPILRLFSFLLKPVFRSNHNWTMQRGEESLKLELQRRRARTPDDLFRVPPPPGPAPIWPWLVGGTAGLLGGVWWTFGRTAVLRTEHSARIDRSVDEVFAFVTAVENDLRWQPEIQEVTVTSPGPLGVGSTFREVRTVGGRGMEWEMRITAFEPPRRICIESVKGTLPYKGCRTFEPVPGGTRIVETSEVRLPLALRPFRGSIKKVSEQSVANAYHKLKALLESQSAQSV